MIQRVRAWVRPRNAAYLGAAIGVLLTAFWLEPNHAQLRLDGNHAYLLGLILGAIIAVAFALLGSVAQVLIDFYFPPEREPPAEPRPDSAGD